MILWQSRVNAMAVTPILWALSITSIRRPVSGVNRRIFPSFHAVIDQKQITSMHSPWKARWSVFDRFYSMTGGKYWVLRRQTKQTNMNYNVVIVKRADAGAEGRGLVFDYWDPPLTMLRPSCMKSSALQVMLGTEIRSSSLEVSACQTLMSSSEHVAKSSDEPLPEWQDRDEMWHMLPSSVQNH